MFSQYTWGDFFKVMGSATVVYYVIIGWKFYREDIRNLLTRKSQKTIESPAVTSSNDDEEEAVSSFYNVSTYQGAPAFAGAMANPANVDSAPASAATTPENKASALAVETVPDSREQTPADPVEEIQEVVESNQEDENSLLTEAPVVEASAEEQTHLLFSFNGQIEPQNEQDLQTVIEAAQEVEIQPGGVATPKPSASRKANLLAETINGQERKSVADILMKSKR